MEAQLLVLRKQCRDKPLGPQDSVPGTAGGQAGQVWGAAGVEPGGSGGCPGGEGVEGRGGGAWEGLWGCQGGAWEGLGGRRGPGAGQQHRLGHSMVMEGASVSDREGLETPRALVQPGKTRRSAGQQRGWTDRELPVLASIW